MDDPVQKIGLSFLLVGMGTGTLCLLSGTAMFDGPQFAWKVLFYASLLVFAASIFIGRRAIDKELGYLIAATPLLAIFITWYWIVPFAREVDLAEFKMAQKAADYGLANFATLDKNSDGILHEEELATAAASAEPNSTDQLLLSHLRNYVSKIGHEVDRYEKRDETIVHVYAISRSELPSYAKWVKERHDLWLQYDG